MSDFESRLSALEAELGQLRDREAIRDVLYRYCRGVDRLDADVLKSCYHDDGYDTHWFSNGPAQAFSEWVTKECLPSAHSTVHSISNPIIELDGDRAFVESHVHVLHELAIPTADPQTPHMHQLGEFRYLDIFEKRDGEWKILYRHVVIDNMVEFQVPVYPQIAAAEAYGKRGGRHDPLYVGFDLQKLRPEDARMNFFDMYLQEPSTD